ncbi:MAG TPA: hypothetical protein VK766_08150 [Cytophagaceae bacterium]|jgi:hypothetical protein|nr:hypothetical protein [Cytophagaceae bacterium]
MEERLNRYREIFWDAFHRPKLYTEKFSNIWLSLEPLNEQISGPLFSVFENGHCDFFFQDKNRFPWMNLPEDFMQWCSDRIEKYKQTLEDIKAIGEEEEHDKEILLFQVDIKMELADIALDIQTERYFKK